MNVSELIKAVSRYNPDLQVMSGDGYNIAGLSLDPTGADVLYLSITNNIDVVSGATGVMTSVSQLLRSLQNYREDILVKSSNAHDLVGPILDRTGLPVLYLE